MSFPPISWWFAVIPAKECLLDIGEHFEKATYRNRYRIAAANGPALLTIPLQGGRKQRTAMHEILIDNRTHWQAQHWRTIFSAYGRAPFFSHYSRPLEAMLLQPYKNLASFNKATLDFVVKELRLKLSFSETETYRRDYGSDLTDIRKNTGNTGQQVPHYMQVFEDRYGFVADLSILDLLLNEGPATISLLLSNA